MTVFWLAVESGLWLVLASVTFGWSVFAVYWALKPEPPAPEKLEPRFWAG